MNPKGLIAAWLMGAAGAAQAAGLGIGFSGAQEVPMSWQSLLMIALAVSLAGGWMLKRQIPRELGALLIAVIAMGGALQMKEAWSTPEYTFIHLTGGRYATVDLPPYSSMILVSNELGRTVTIQSIQLTGSDASSYEIVSEERISSSGDTKAIQGQRAPSCKVGFQLTADELCSVSVTPRLPG